jgi:hypothetical protein
MKQKKSFNYGLILNFRDTHSRIHTYIHICMHRHFLIEMKRFKRDRDKISIEIFLNNANNFCVCVKWYTV